MTDTPGTDTQTTDKPQLTVKVEDAGPARKKVIIEVPEARIKGKTEDLYGSLENDAVIPGFRRGRAPRRLLEKRFGESVKTDTKSQVISEAYSQAIDDQKIDVLGEPVIKDLETLELPASGAFTFEVEVEVTPEVELPDFKTVNVEKGPAEVAESDVDAELGRYAERFGSIAEAEDGTVAAGDYVQSDVKITGEDGAVIVEQNDAYAIAHGADREFKGHVLGILVDDLGKRLIGKKVGDGETIAMTGPSGHENEAIKGKPITIALTIKKVERVKPVELELLATQMGFESVEKMREDVRGMLSRRKEAEQRSDMHQQVREQLVDAVKLELPEGITGRQTERNLQRQKLEMLYRGMSEEDVEQKLAELRTESAEAAQRQLAEFFILDAAAKKLEVEVQENEVNGRIAMLAMQQNRRPEKLRQEMRRRGELENLYLQIREQKTLDKVLESATVTEVAERKAEPGEKKKSGKKKSSKKKAEE